MPKIELETKKDTSKNRSDLADPKRLDEEIKEPLYTDAEKTYLDNVQRRLEYSKTLRDQSRDEWDGMDYVTYWTEMEKLANTFIKPKKNKEDSNFQSGTIRQKLFALLSALNNLDLSPDILAYDKEDFEVQSVGDAMEDIIEKTENDEGDDEKKLLRQFELLKHGHVFVEEVWEERWQKRKTMRNKEFKGDVKGVEWTSRLKKIGRPVRKIRRHTQVYLGSMRVYDNAEQPYQFDVEFIPYEEVKQIYEEWERFKHVRRQITKTTNLNEPNIYNNTWTLFPEQDGLVEVIKYQDKWNDELQIILNGVLMLPVGFPLSAISKGGEYTIVQQNLEPIRADFAYGRGVVARLRTSVGLLDEMLKLAVLKTQKSFVPPYLNNTGKILSPRIFMPGKITSGIQPGMLQPLTPKESEGVTNSEFNMIQELMQNADRNSVNPQFTGQKAEGPQTATETLELQRQARLMLGVTVFAATMLEHKLAWLRLYNILGNWFSPIDEVVDEERKILRNKYRSVTLEKLIEDEGTGRRSIIATENPPTPRKIFEEEEQFKERTGTPIRKIYLNVAEMTSMKYTYQVTIKPKEKNTSEMNKLLFRGMLQDATELFGPILNLNYLAEEFATMWQRDPAKLFKQQEGAQNPEQQVEQAAQKRGPQAPSPGLNNAAPSLPGITTNIA